MKTIWKNNNISYLLFKIIMLFCIPLLFLTFMFSLNNPKNFSNLQSNRMAIISTSKNTSRICNGVGEGFSCQNIFSNNYKSKKKIIDKAQYLYIKANPYLINIKAIRFEFVPKYSMDKYKLMELKIETSSDKLNVFNVTNNLNKSLITIGSLSEYSGYISFNYEFSNILSAPKQIELKGLNDGALTIKYLNTNNEVVAINKIETKNKNLAIIKVKNAVFVKNIGMGRIMSKSFKSFPYDVQVTRATLNSVPVKLDQIQIETTNIKNKGIVLKSFGNWIIELKVNTGNFDNFTLQIEGLASVEAVVSVSPIRIMDGVFKIRGVVKKPIQQQITFSLTSDFFLMETLLVNTVVYNSELNNFLSVIWPKMTDSLEINKPIKAEYFFNSLSSLSSDVFSIPYSELTLVSKIPSIKKVDALTMIQSANPSIKVIKLDGVSLLTNNVVLTMPNLTTLSLVNAKIFDTAFLKRSRKGLTKLINLDLSKNDLRGNNSLFNDVANYSLINMKISNANLIGNSLIPYFSTSIQPLDNSLKSLDLSYNDFNTLPSFNNKLNALETLLLNNNEIKTISSLEQFKISLKTLNLNRNYISSTKFLSFSTRLKNSLINLDLGNNIEIEPVFISNDTYPKLEFLNLENTKFTKNVIDSLKNFQVPKLENLNISNTNLGDKSLSLLSFFLRDHNINTLNISNNNISNVQLGILLDANFIVKLQNLDISNNVDLSEFPLVNQKTSSSLQYLNISKTSIFKLNNLKVNNLVARDLKRFSLKTILSLIPTIDSYDFQNSLIVLDKTIPIPIKTIINLNSARLFFLNKNIYDLMTLRITPYMNMIASIKEKLLLDINEHREKIDLAKKNVFDSSDINNPQMLAEPLKYQQTLSLKRIDNTIEKENKLTTDIAKETNYLVTNNVYHPKKIEKIIKTFKISFDDYGVFWSKSYLAAIVLAPLMIIVFSLTNLIFAYHYYKIRKRKKNRGIYEKEN